MMKTNKKGFTLIELLAIIVILAIIAVITVPIILNIIENAREGAAKNSVIGYGKAVETAYTQYQYEKELNGATDGVNKYLHPVTGQKSVSIIFATGAAKTLVVDYDGDDVVCSGTNTIDADGKVTLNTCSVNSSTTTYNYAKGSATKN